MTLPHLALAVALCFVFGLNFPFAKWALAELPPIATMALRFAIAGLVIVPFVPRPKGHWRDVLWIALVLGVLHFSIMFTGFAGVDAAVAAVAVQLQVPFAAILAYVLLKDRLGWRRLAGMVIAFGGVMLMAGEPRLQSSLSSLGLVVLAALVWAYANVLIRQLQGVGAQQLNGWVCLIAAPLLALISAVLEDGQVAAFAEASLLAWGSVAFMTIATTIICFALWYRLVQRYPVNVTMPLTLLVPVFGVANSVFLLGERLSWQTAGGAALTLIGVAVIVLRRPQALEPRGQASAS